MSVRTPEAIERRAYRYQQAANALTEVRSRAADPLASYILTTPNYRSWGLAGVVGALKVTDKVDGLFAKRRAKLLESLASEDGTSYEIKNQKLVEAIEWGGINDPKADKKLNHAIFGSIAVRDALNHDWESAVTTVVADGIITIRDKWTDYERSLAALRGHNGHSRFPGQVKELLIDLTSVAAVSPLAERGPEGQDLTAGRVAVCALYGASTASAIGSGIGQVIHMRTPIDQTAPIAA